MPDNTSKIRIIMAYGSDGQNQGGKEKWTLSFDPTLKCLVTQAAKRKGVYPVTLLEELVRERFNPYGHSEVKNSRAYVTALRKQARGQSDEEFLADLRAWQKSPSS